MELSPSGRRGVPPARGGVPQAPFFDNSGNGPPPPHAWGWGWGGGPNNNNNRNSAWGTGGNHNNNYNHQNPYYYYGPQNIPPPPYNNNGHHHPQQPMMMPNGMNYYNRNINNNQQQQQNPGFMNYVWNCLWNNNNNQNQNGNYHYHQPTWDQNSYFPQNNNQNQQNHHHNNYQQPIPGENVFSAAEYTGQPMVGNPYRRQQNNSDNNFQQQQFYNQAGDFASPTVRQRLYHTNAESPYNTDCSPNNNTSGLSPSSRNNNKSDSIWSLSASEKSHVYVNRMIIILVCVACYMIALSLEIWFGLSQWRIFQFLPELTISNSILASTTTTSGVMSGETNNNDSSRLQSSSTRLGDMFGTVFFCFAMWFFQACVSGRSIASSSFMMMLVGGASICFMLADHEHVRYLYGEGLYRDVYNNYQNRNKNNQYQKSGGGGIGASYYRPPPQSQHQQHASGNTNNNNQQQQQGEAQQGWMSFIFSFFKGNTYFTSSSSSSNYQQQQQRFPGQYVRQKTLFRTIYLALCTLSFWQAFGFFIAGVVLLWNHFKASVAV